MKNDYSAVLVLISLAISLLACWTALELSCRVHAQRSAGKKAFWLGSGALIMGLGIWAMHYVGMLALRTSMPVSYHWPTVFLSFFAAVAASGVALFWVNRPNLSLLRMIGGGIVMGGGIASMHYIGMSAMRMSCKLSYSIPLVLLSLLLAVGISMVALRLCFSAKEDASAWSMKKIGSALLMGIAVPSMHYVGMAAARIQPMAGGALIPESDPLAIQVSQLGIAAVIGTVALCICFALLCASFNRNSLAVEYKLQLAKNEHELLNGYQERLIKAYRQNGVGAWEWDPATDSFAIDPSLQTIYDSDLLAGKPVPRAQLLAQVHPEDLPLMRERWAAALDTGIHYENEYRIFHRDGKMRRCRSVATVARDANGGVTSVFGMSWDITVEHQHQQDHAAEARRFYVTLEAIGDAVIAVDAEHRILYANPVACELTGWRKDECLGRPFAEVFIAEDESTGVVRRSAVQRCIELGGKLLCEDGILLGKNGARYNIQKHVNLVEDYGGAVVTFRDITAARKLKRDLEIAATHDNLTGLPNRVAFERLLKQVWDTSREGNQRHCLALLDLDRFKLVNDTAGHLAGDALLREVVRTLEPKLRKGDLLARMGGDEFLLLVRDTNPDEAHAFCQTLIRAVEDLHFVWRKRIYSVTASLGMVFFDKESPSFEELTSHADVALFTSKRNGRNCLTTYESSIGEASDNLLEMKAVSELRSALQEDRFELHAQPIVALRKSDAEPYFELLVRMRDRSGALIPPSQFIPAAECYGMMQQLDRWVVHHALAMYAEHLHAGSNMRFAINLSADSLSDPTLWNFVYEQFQITQVPPGSITFEVTESGLIRNLGAAETFLRLAQNAGCRIALDDFGTGMSSLSYLKQFPLDVIKIDGSFVRKILLTPLDRSIVQAINQIAHDMGARTVAECAEDMKTVELLSSLGVDYVQGWATGKPEALLPLLQEMRSAARPAALTSNHESNLLDGILPLMPASEFAW